MSHGAGFARNSPVPLRASGRGGLSQRSSSCGVWIGLREINKYAGGRNCIRELVAVTGLSPHDRDVAAIADLVLHFYAAPSPAGTGRGSLRLASADLNAIAFAVLVSEDDGRPMNPSKLSDFAGLPRPTLYRKLESLRREGVIGPDHSAIRFTPAYLDSEGLTEGIGLALAALSVCVSRLPSKPPVESRPRVRFASKRGVVATLALDLARLSHDGPGPWFAADARMWLVRWIIARAQAEGRYIAPGEIAEQAGVSRTAVYRHLADLDASGHLHRLCTGRFGIPGAGDPCSEHGRRVARMVNCIYKAFHNLSDLDG